MHRPRVVTNCPVHADTSKSRRGVAGEWIVSHAELTRVKNEGLLPDPRPY